MNVNKRMITDQLDFYGIKRSLRGYIYLCQSIAYIMSLPENTWYNVKMTNEVYAYVGDLYGYTSSANIARNIGHAIKKSREYGTEILPSTTTAKSLIYTIVTNISTLI